MESKKHFNSIYIFNYTIVPQVIETTATKSITIGQAHFDGLSGSCSICVELEWNDGVINSHMRDSNCKTVKQVFTISGFAY